MAHTWAVMYMGTFGRPCTDPNQLRDFANERGGGLTFMEARRFLRSNGSQAEASACSNAWQADASASALGHASGENVTNAGHTTEKSEAAHVRVVPVKLNAERLAFGYAWQAAASASAPGHASGENVTKAGHTTERSEAAHVKVVPVKLKCNLDDVLSLQNAFRGPCVLNKAVSEHLTDAS